MERRRIRITKPKTPVRKTPIPKKPVVRQRQRQRQQQQLVQTLNIGALAPPPKPKRKYTRKPKPPAPKPPPDTQVPQPFQTPSVIFRPQFLDKPSVGTEDIKKIIESLVEKENNRLINTLLQRNRDNAPDAPVRETIPQPTPNHLSFASGIGNEKSVHNYADHMDRGLLVPQYTTPAFEPFASSSGIPTADKPDEEEEEATQARRDQPVASSSTAPVASSSTAPVASSSSSTLLSNPDNELVRKYFSFDKKKDDGTIYLKARGKLERVSRSAEKGKDPTQGIPQTGKLNRKGYTEEEAFLLARTWLADNKITE